MASLKQQLDDAGFDTTNFDEDAVLKQLDAAGYDVSSYTSPSIAQQNLNEVSTQGPLDELKGAFSEGGKLVKAGWAGIGDLLAAHPEALIPGGGAIGLAEGKNGTEGLNQAATDINKVYEGQAPETPAAKVGEAVGSMATPRAIATQAVAGGIVEAASALGIGDWISSTLGGWAQKAALAAIGYVKKIGQLIGVDNFDSFAQFLLKPITVFGQEFGPVITSTSTPASMKEVLTAIQNAAKEALESLTPAIDDAIADAPDGTDPMDLEGTHARLKALQQQVTEYTPEMGEDLGNKIQVAINDFNRTMSKAADKGNQFTAARGYVTSLGKIIDNWASETPGKMALKQTWGAVRQGVENAAGNAGSATKAAFDEANNAYHCSSIALDALNGQAISSAAGKGLNWLALVAPALASTIGHFVGGNLGAAALAGTAAAAQMVPSSTIAAGLNTVAPAIGPIAGAITKAIPIGVNAIAQGLSARQ